ncbi:hypothetical protein MSIMFI_00001 [Mycobacterium simulans]|nr:hypothetical protein MSIMFI_00001 [Mycobacterium simulans]
MAADTSSAPAATRDIVGAAAAALASLIDEPTLAKSVAAAARNSGVAMRYDMRDLPPPAAGTARPPSNPGAKSIAIKR